MSLVAWRTRRTPRFTDFALANKRLPYFLIFASLASTYIGPGFTIGAADKGLATGLYSFLLFLPFALQATLVGIFVAPRLAALTDCASIGDVMGRVYGRWTQLLAGVSSVGICVLFTAFLAKVSGEILLSFTGIPFWVGVIIVTAFSVSYTVYGGLRANVVTDAVQFAIFTIVVPLVALLTLSLHDFDITTATTVALVKTESSWTSDTWLSAAGVALSFLLGETLIPPYANRALASQSPQSSKRSFILAGVFCIFWLAVVTGIGIAAGQILPPSKSSNGALLGLADLLLPPGLWGILLVAIISILMSSQESVLNAGAVSITRDLLRPSVQLTEHSQMVISRLGTVAIGVLGCIIAGWLPAIIDALLIIYSIWAPTVLVPLVLGLLISSPGTNAGWASILAGGFTSIIWQSVLNNPGSIPAILPGLAASLIAYFAGHILSKDCHATSLQRTSR